MSDYPAPENEIEVEKPQETGYPYGMTDEEFTKHMGDQYDAWTAAGPEERKHMEWVSAGMPGPLEGPEQAEQPDWGYDASYFDEPMNVVRIREAGQQADLMGVQKSGYLSEVLPGVNLAYDYYKSVYGDAPVETWKRPGKNDTIREITSKLKPPPFEAMPDTMKSKATWSLLAEQNDSKMMSLADVKMSFPPEVQDMLLAAQPAGYVEAGKVMVPNALAGGYAPDLGGKFTQVAGVQGELSQEELGQMGWLQRFLAENETLSNIGAQMVMGGTMGLPMGVPGVVGGALTAGAIAGAGLLAQTSQGWTYDTALGALKSSGLDKVIDTDPSWQAAIKYLQTQRMEKKYGAWTTVQTPKTSMQADGTMPGPLKPSETLADLMSVMGMDFFEVLNVPFDWLQGAVGTLEMAAKRIMDPEKYGPLSEVTQNITETWAANTIFYRVAMSIVLADATGSKYTDKDGNVVRTYTSLRSAKPTEVVVPGKMGSTKDSIDYVIEQMRDELKKSVNLEEQLAIREKYRMKFGLVGDVGDIAAGFLLDPLDSIPVARNKGIETIGRMSKDDPLIKAATAKQVNTTRELLAQYKINLRMLSDDERLGLNSLQKFIGGLNKEGVAKEMDNTMTADTFFQNIKNPDWWLGLTPASKAAWFTSNAMEGVQSLLGNYALGVDGTVDPDLAFKMINSLARVDAFVRNAEGNPVLSIDGTEREIPKSAGGAVMQSVPLAIRSKLDLVKKIVDDYKIAQTVNAPLVTKIATAVGEKPEKFMSDIQKGNAGYADARLAKLKKDHPEIDLTGLTGQKLKDIVKVFYGENALPFNSKMFTLKLLNILDEGLGQYAKDYYGVKPPNWWTRVGDAVKKAQSLALLGLNPINFLNNTINNMMTMGWDGLLNLPDYAANFGRDEKFWVDNFGFVPADYSRGWNPQEMGEMQTGVLSLSKEEAAYAKEIGLRAPTATARDILNTAYRGTAQKSLAEKAVDGASILGLFARLSGKGESIASQIAMTNSAREYLRHNLKIGAGVDAMPKNVSDSLDRLSPGASKRVQDAIIDNPNISLRDLELAVFGEDRNPTMKETLSDSQYETLEKLAPGLVDKIETALKTAKTPDEVHRIMQDARKDFGNAIRQQVIDKTKEFVEDALTKAYVEKTQGVLDAADQIDGDYRDALTQHFERMEQAAAEADRLARAGEWAKRSAYWSEVLTDEDFQFQTIRLIHYNKWIGAWKGLGAHEMDPSYAKFMNSYKEQGEVWNAFYQRRRELMQRYQDETAFISQSSRNETEKANAQSEVWGRISEELNTEYASAILGEDITQSEMNEAFTKQYADQIMSTHGGHENAEDIIRDAKASAANWRNSVQMIRRKMSASMLVWRAGKLPDEIKAKWGDALTEAEVKKITDISKGLPAYRIKVGSKSRLFKKFMDEVYTPYIGMMSAASAASAPKPPDLPQRPPTGGTEPPPPTPRSPRPGWGKMDRDVVELVTSDPLFANLRNGDDPKPNMRQNILDFVNSYRNDLTEPPIKSANDITRGMLDAAVKNYDEYAESFGDTLSGIVGQTPTGTGFMVPRAIVMEMNRLGYSNEDLKTMQPAEIDRLLVNKIAKVVAPAADAVTPEVTNVTPEVTEPPAPPQQMKPIQLELPLDPESQAAQEQLIAQYNAAEVDEMIEQNTGQKVIEKWPEYTFKQLRNDLQTIFGYETKELNAAITPYIALAEEWARRTGKKPEEWLSRWVAGVIKGRKGLEGGEQNQNMVQTRTDTPEFKAWFGDSKVVDEQGNPLVVYHGRMKQFDAFNTKLYDHNFITGSYWSPNRKTATYYMRPDKRGDIVEAYLSIKNPADDKIATQVYEELMASGRELPWEKGLIMQEELIKRGYDGWFHKTPQEMEYITFFPEQIKSVNNRGTWDAKDPRIQYQTEQQQRWYYSKLLRTVEAFPQSQFTVQQLKGFMNGKGIKADELYWTGLDEWLERKNWTSLIGLLKDDPDIKTYLDKGYKIIPYSEIPERNRLDYQITDGPDNVWLTEKNDALTKESVVGFLKSNEVTVEEVMYGPPGKGDRIDRSNLAIFDQHPGSPLSRWTNMRMRPYAETAVTEQKIYYGPSHAGVLIGLEDGRYRVFYLDRSANVAGTENVGSVEEAREFIARNLNEQAEYSFADTRYETYNVPGGQRYRELLLTFPGSASLRHGYQLPHFRSSHWKEENVVAHIRFDERVDENGNKVLTILEVQSDWHQKGRKQGYGVPKITFFTMGDVVQKRLVYPQGKALAEYDFKDKITGAEWKIWEEDDGTFQFGYGGSYATPEFALEDLNRHRQNSWGTEPSDFYRVPDVPFKNNWDVLSLKRMVRWAAENGYDKLAWVTGPLAAKVEGQSIVDEITKLGWNSSTGDLMYERKTGEQGNKTGLTDKELADYIGGDAAEQLLAQPEVNGIKELDTQNIVFGGAKYRWWYDRNMVNNANSFLKKFGVQVEDGRVGTGLSRDKTSFRMMQAGGRWGIEYIDGQTGDLVFLEFNSESEAVHKLHDLRSNNEKNSYGSVHTIQITPELARSAMQGFELFQDKRGATRWTEQGKAVIHALESADKTTAIHELAHVWLQSIANEPMFREDLVVIENWMKETHGIDLGPNWIRDTARYEKAHEIFAKVLEQYHFEGKAPQNSSLALIKVLNAIKQWFVDIYKNLTAVDAKMTPEVKQVIDGWYGDYLKDPANKKNEIMRLARNYDKSFRYEEHVLNTINKYGREMGLWTEKKKYLRLDEVDYWDAHYTLAYSKNQWMDPVQKKNVEIANAAKPLESIDFRDMRPLYQRYDREWWKIEFTEDMYESLKNRLADELSIAEFIFNETIPEDQLIPFRKNSKNKNAPEANLLGKYLDKWIVVRDADGKRVGPTEKMAEILNPSVPVEKLLADRGVTPANGLYGTFKGRLNGIRNGWINMDKKPKTNGDGTLDRNNALVLSKNGKAGGSVDYPIATCIPTSPCRECYACTGNNRASTMAKAERNLIYTLLDPERFAKRTIAELKLVPKEDMLFLRLLGSGDITFSEQVDAFNFMAQYGDRPIQVFSRHHDRLAELKGTQNAPFIKMGSIDSDLVQFYGLDRLKENMSKHGINNAFLYAGTVEITDAQGNKKTVDEYDEFIKPLFEANELGLVLSADHSLHTRLPDEIKVMSCPCDAGERTFVSSCKTCGLLGAGCFMRFNKSFVNPDGSIVSEHFAPADNPIPLLNFRAGEQGAGAKYFARTYADIIDHDLSGIDLQFRAWRGTEKKRKAEKKAGAEIYDFLGDNENHTVVISTDLNPGATVRFVDFKKFIARENEVRAKASQIKPMMTAEEIHVMVLDMNENRRKKGLSPITDAEIEKNVAQRNKKRQNPTGADVQPPMTDAEIDAAFNTLLINPANYVFRDQSEMLRSIEHSIRMLESNRDYAVETQTFYLPSGELKKNIDPNWVTIQDGKKFVEGKAAYRLDPDETGYVKSMPYKPTEEDFKPIDLVPPDVREKRTNVAPPGPVDPGTLYQSYVITDLAYDVEQVLKGKRNVNDYVKEDQPQIQTGIAEMLDIWNGKRGTKSWNKKWIPILKKWQERTNGRPAVGAQMGTADEHAILPRTGALLNLFHNSIDPSLRQTDSNVSENIQHKERLGKLGIKPEGAGKLDDNSKGALRNYFNHAKSQIGDVKHGALQWAKSRRDFALLNYNRKTGFDQMFGGVIAPYEFWYTRNMMNWALRVLDKPSIMASQYRMMQAMERQADEDEGNPGYPTRLYGKIPINAAWSEDWMGQYGYIDPMRQVFPYMQLARPFETMNKENAVMNRRVQQAIEDMIAYEKISEEEGQQALASRQGPIYETAIAQAQSEVDQTIQNPADVMFTMFGPSLPLSVGYNLMMGRKDRIGNLPMTRTFEQATALMGANQGRGYNPEQPFRDLFELGNDKFKEAKIAFQISNMAVEDPSNIDALMQALATRDGPMWREAQRRAIRTDIAKIPLAPFGGDFYPPAEAAQRAIAEEYKEAKQAYLVGDKDAKNKFFDKYPEATVRWSSFDKPADVMKSYLTSQLWDKYLLLDSASQKSAREAFGDQFQTAFLNKATRSYNSINVQTLASWVKTLDGWTPEGTVMQGGYKGLPKEDATSVKKFYEDKNRLFKNVSDSSKILYSLPENMQPAFRKQHPEVEAYSRWRYKTLFENPQLLKYVLSEQDELYGLPYDLQKYVVEVRHGVNTLFPNLDEAFDNVKKNPNDQGSRTYINKYYTYINEKAAKNPSAASYILSDNSLSKAIKGENISAADRKQIDAYYSQRDLKFPNITNTQTEYFALPEGQRKAYLNAHPKLSQYWDWQSGMFRTYPKLASYVSEDKAQRMMSGGYGSSYNLAQMLKDAPIALSSQINALVAGGQPLSGQALKELERRWVIAGRPEETFEKWLKLNLPQAMR